MSTRIDKAASLKPVPLSEAARVLAERYPEHAYTVRQLRQMAQNGSIDTVQPPRGVSVCRNHRPVTYWVRIPSLITTFLSWEKPAIRR